MIFRFRDFCTLFRCPPRPFAVHREQRRKLVQRVTRDKAAGCMFPFVWYIRLVEGSVFNPPRAFYKHQSIASSDRWHILGINARIITGGQISCGQRRWIYFAIEATRLKLLGKYVHFVIPSIGFVLSIRPIWRIHRRMQSRGWILRDIGFIAIYDNYNSRCVMCRWKW